MSKKPVPSIELSHVRVAHSKFYGLSGSFELSVGLLQELGITILDSEGQPLAQMWKKADGQR